jgi:hypothetical protein
MAMQFVFGSSNNQNLAFRLFHSNWTIPAKENNVGSSDSAMSIAYGISL